MRDHHFTHSVRKWRAHATRILQPECMCLYCHSTAVFRMHALRVYARLLFLYEPDLLSVRCVVFIIMGMNYITAAGYDTSRPWTQKPPFHCVFIVNWLVLLIADRSLCACVRACDRGDVGAQGCPTVSAIVFVDIGWDGLRFSRRLVIFNLSGYFYQMHNTSM